jgi:phosphoribosyl 1,2-cyclic phosphodiesterase
MLKFTILASGSSGNAAYLETDGVRILIDAGLSGKQIEERLSQIGVSARDLQAVFVTHEHSDHVCGLGVMAKRFGLPVYCNRLTAESLRPNMASFQGWQLFETGSTILLGDLKIDTFAVPHDAYDPVGFVFHHRQGSVGFLTDLGYATKLVLERVRVTRALVLEANHDLQLLQNDARRPWSVKQRILSRHGHLSNRAAADVAEHLIGGDLEDLYLGHLSSDCNTPELARQAVEERLDGALSRVRVHDTAPDRISPTLFWE